MNLKPTPLAGVWLVEPTVHADARGWFLESFHSAQWVAALQAAGQADPGPFVQDNHSFSHAGVLRGLHYQRAPHAQGKLVRVVQGSAFDVAVDVRPQSPQFGRWFGVELSAANRCQLWIPAGYAHGMLALQDNTQVLYKMTQPYEPASERSIRWDDQRIGIVWPWPEGSGLPVLSPKDTQAPGLDAIETEGF
jgi:dTDP-4-dehydrorhamnose 3,5-epimerase